jgi:hypothetical protein
MILGRRLNSSGLEQDPFAGIREQDNKPSVLEPSFGILLQIRPWQVFQNSFNAKYQVNNKHTLFIILSLKAEYYFMFLKTMLPTFRALYTHFCHHIRNHLDREMAGRWMGRGGSVAWPPRSPDLMPLDFFFRCYVKNIVYQVMTNDFKHPKACIRDTVAKVTPTCSKQRGTRLNIVWIFVVSPRETILKFIEEVIY